MGTSPAGASPPPTPEGGGREGIPKPHGLFLRSPSRYGSALTTAAAVEGRRGSVRDDRANDVAPPFGRGEGESGALSNAARHTQALSPTAKANTHAVDPALSRA